MNHLQLINALKRELKARDLTYADLAARIDMSEASVKRMLGSGKLGLDQLDAILTAVGLDWGDLINQGSQSDAYLERLTKNQEAALVAEPKLFAVAVSTMNSVPSNMITREFAITEAELVGALTKLDKMGFLTLHEGNRYALKLSRTFQWIPNGPIQDFFRGQSGDYLSREFDKNGEHFQVVNVLLSQASSQKIARRLREVAQEINALHFADSRLPFAERGAQTMLLGLRPWMPPFLRALRQKA